MNHFKQAFFKQNVIRKKKIIASFFNVVWEMPVNFCSETNFFKIIILI